MKQNRIQQNFSRAADAYDGHAKFQQQQSRRVYEMAKQVLPEIAHIADIGCGTGQFALNAAALRPQWHITGIDFSEGMAHHAAKRCSHVLVGNATALPLADGSMDGIVSSLCMQWVENKPGMLAEIRRVLKPQGQAMLSTLADRTLWELREAGVAAGISVSLLPMLAAKDYRMLADRSGMNVAGFQQTVEVDQYQSVETLLRSIRAIGAGSAEGRRSVIPPRRFARMIQHYEASHGDGQHIRASWQPVLMLLRKP